MAKIYPDLEYLSEVQYDKKPSNLETNCGQIFSKTPAITKELLDIIELKDIGPKKTSVCGYGFKTRRIWVLSGLFLLFLSSFTGSIIMWSTDMFDQAVFSNLVLTNRSLAFRYWVKPPIKPILKVHIFNYTNVQDLQNGLTETLRVQEVGPFVYEEILEKINLNYYDDDTVSYQEKRSYELRKDLSSSKINHSLIVPNLPMLGIVSISRFSYYMTRLTLSTLFNGMNVSPFLSLPAHKFIWGYEDILYTLVKSVLPVEKGVPTGNFGLLMTRNGTSSDEIRVHTGKSNPHNINYIDTFNGQRSLPFFTGECNRIDASDGSIFPSDILKKREPVYVYKRELCRRIPLVYEKEVNVLNGRIPAVRYKLPENMYDTSVEENKCFCSSKREGCSPKGVFNATACFFGAPVFLSLPHFYNGDPALLKNVEGLSPSREKHDSFIDFHQFGFPMVANAKIQLNVMVRKPFGISQVDMFREEMLLPVAWVEMGFTEEDLPEEVVNIVNILTFTVPNTKSALKYGSVLTTLVTFFAILIVLRNQFLERGEDDFRNTISIQS